MPRKIYSDNATNFVGADPKLRELRDAFAAQQTEVQKYATGEGFTFDFISPRAPHFDGLWETAVKSAKHLLVRAIGNALLTGVELQTLLAEVEAILNSRPLVPLRQDPNDGEARTPAHLLVGCPFERCHQPKYRWTQCVAATDGNLSVVSSYSFGDCGPGTTCWFFNRGASGSIRSATSS
ncbi:uncharacterized protein LOC129251317 [Anastrepha obliqua]|uniref:uncharacterized protein LOC129251317 n=1 Tax=Anastrepha obliqua TaxID=95512 RepID=UPI0024099B97|nr:uncharacterized protein LOC129251317 [Anastrepha obliqua]